MVYHYGHIAVLYFFGSLLIYLLTENFSESIFSYYTNYISYRYWIHLVNYGIICLFIKTISNSTSYQVAVRAIFLGYSFATGICFYYAGRKSWRSFGVYTTVLSVFHLTEFLAIAFTNPVTLTVDNFVINQSGMYTLAATSSWVEFLVERLYYPVSKQSLWIPIIGVILCGVGEMVRKLAIFTAKRNFNHIVQYKKANDHTLVTHGVYNFCRHPSYVGWFYWCIGTQLILQNPLSLLIYAVTSWKFFEERIFIEELNLVNFFGNAYIQYQEKVKTGLPFIVGYTDINVK